MTSDLASIETVLIDYLDGLYDGDVGRLAGIFLPQANLYASIDGKLATLSLADWLDRVSKRQSARAAGHASTNRILGIDINGSAALARVTCSHPPSNFTDYINLLKLESGWKIIAKVYHVSPLV